MLFYSLCLFANLYVHVWSLRGCSEVALRDIHLPGPLRSVEVQGEGRRGAEVRREEREVQGPGHVGLGKPYRCRSEVSGLHNIECARAVPSIYIHTVHSTYMYTYSYMKGSTRALIQYSH